MKSKQELIDKWESAIEAAEFYGKGKEESLISYMRDFVDDLNQLDEPEVLSQEWIDEHKESWQDLSITGYSVPEKDLQNLLVPKQIKPKELYKAITGISPFIEEVCDSSGTETFLDESVSVERIVETVMEAVGPSEPEKPVIPQFVADFIKDKEEWMLFELFDENYLYDDHPEVAKWLYDDNSETNRKRELLLVRAKTKGYEIKQEQKYVVPIGENHALCKFANDAWGIYKEDIDKLYLDDDFKFTEQEIKDYDERFWPFAVKVKELEE